MKIFVYIALVAFLSSIYVKAYGPVKHYKYNRRTHGPPNRSPDGLHSSPTGQRNRRPSEFYYFSRPYGYFRSTQSWDDPTEWDSESDSSENDEYSSENDEVYDDWHNFHHTERPCARPMQKPASTAKTFVPKTTLTKRPRQTQATVQHQTANPLAITPNSTPRTTRPITSTEVFEKTTSPQPTTITKKEFPTLSPETLNCFESCTSRLELNPVSVTDGGTYENEGKLRCAESCGIDISLQRSMVYLQPISTEGHGGPSPTPLPTITSSRAPVARTTFVSSLHRCMKQCAITPYITPVCGTNFVTYMNTDRLKCARDCGEDVEVLCEKPCAACGIASVTVNPKTTPSTVTTGNFGRITQAPVLKECIAKCPATLESNPVCGTDQVTYRNPSHLLCAQMCGVGVSIDRFSPCLPTATYPPSSTTSELSRTTISISQLTCATRCRVTSEYNPVCGTNDLTYSNPGALQCAKNCGIKVELKKEVPCNLDFANGKTDSTTLRTAPNINENTEVVPTISRKTATTTSLFTSAVLTTTPLSTSTTTTAPIMMTTLGATSTSLGFSIPPEILNLIFGSTTTQMPPSVTPDDDENLDIDFRFSNNSGNNSDISGIILP